MTKDWGMGTKEGNLHVDAMMRRVLYLVRCEQHPTLVANRISELKARVRREHPEVDSQLVFESIYSALHETVKDKVGGDAYLAEVSAILGWYR